MPSILANIEETLLRAIYTTPIIDNHAHPLLKPAALKGKPLLSIMTEAHGDALKDSRTSLAHIRAVKQLSDILGCQPTWEAVTRAIKQKREGKYEEWIRRCLSGIDIILVDDGLDGPENAESFDYFDKFTRSPNKRIVRIEHVVEGIVREILSKNSTESEMFAAVVIAYKQAIKANLADPDVVGFKSVICYRTGLDIPRTMSVKMAQSAFGSLIGATMRDYPFQRLQHQGLNEYFVHLLARMIRDDPNPHKKPMQFHTGLGDNDITLTKSSPAHLQEFIREYPTVPIVLLHGGYPYTREMGYLSTVYANVYADIGEVFPFVSRDGQEGVVRQILELCPGSKIIWSTDGHWFPETYILAVEQVRSALKTVLSEYVNKGDLTWVQAAKMVEDMLFHNSNRLYNLDLELEPTPTTNGEALQTGALMNGHKADYWLTVLSSYLKTQDGPRFLRINWCDYTAMPRTKLIPLRRVVDILKNGDEICFGVAKASLGVLQNDHLAKGVTSSGEYDLHPT